MEIIDTHMHLWTPETHPWVLDFKDGGHPAGKWGKIAKTPSRVWGLITILLQILFKLLSNRL